MAILVYEGSGEREAPRPYVKPVEVTLQVKFSREMFALEFEKAIRKTGGETSGYHIPGYIGHRIGLKRNKDTVNLIVEASKAEEAKEYITPKANRCNERKPVEIEIKAQEVAIG